MYIIAGLGNPGKKYEHTRHNTGFDVMDALSEKTGIEVTHREHRALVGKGLIGVSKCILVKPQTFMNLSGESIREIAEYYGVEDTSHIIVISDDVALPIGQIRVRKKGERRRAQRACEYYSESCDG